MLSTNSFIPSHIQFSSSFGKHVAVHMNNGTLHDLTLLVAETIPGEPLIRNNYLTKRGQIPGDYGLELIFVTYTFDNVNRDIAVEDVQQVNSHNFSALSSGATEALMNHRGWKFCAGVGFGGSGSVQDLESGATGTAIHGELYFNTYGGIDNECNNIENS
ncbi:hypothetical protein MOSE0_H09560 [Monosporozyma servazzii]